MIELKRPLAFFDCESTGLDVAKDRIVSIAIIKIFPDGEVTEKYQLIDPTIEIPAEATKIHGISNENVCTCPTFKQLSKGILEHFKDCDIAGYNTNSYDIPLLCEEFARVGIDFPLPETNFIDVCQIFKKREERTLSAAVKFYCDREFTGAHNALEDTRETIEVFKGQLQHYPDLPNTVEGLCKYTSPEKLVDVAKKITIDQDGDYIYNHGKSKGVKIKTDTRFAFWMLKQDHYTPNTLLWVRKILDQMGVLTT